MILQRGKLRFWEESYINNIFSNYQGDLSFEKKNLLEKKKLSERKQKKPFEENSKKTYCTYTLLPNTRKGSFPSFDFHPYKPKTREKKFFFFSILLLKQHSSLTRGYSLIFQAKNTIKTVNTLWRENQYCINISFLLLSLLFFLIISFNLLFDSIYFFILLIILYTNHFIIFFIFWWVDWCE